MVVLVNRAKMSTSTTGTGTISLGSALAGFQSFANAGVSNGDTVRYVIEEGTNFEIGSGTYTSSGTTLSRNPSESSNSGNAITLGGSAEVFITASAADIFVNDGATSLTTTGVITGGTVEATSDTAAGDNAAMGYTAAEGLILTGQGNVSDITFKNDADAVVFTVPTGTDDILFPNNAKAMFGAGSDLQIYHNATHSYIDNNTGNIYIRSNVDDDDGGNIVLEAKAGENGIIIADDGDVSLHFNGNSKLATTNTGVAITGDVVASGTVEPAGDTAAGDNAAIGYTAAEGLILTGQGSTSDITFKNDADAAVFNIPTGTTTLNVTGTVQADQFNNDEALPDIRPSLLLDFANSKTLDPRITFTRGSTATYYDGKTTAKAEENLLKYSQELDNAAWIPSGTTITANDTTAPDGTTTAEKLAISTEGNYRNVSQRPTGLPSKAYTLSVYLKKSNYDYISINLQSRTSSSGYINSFGQRTINLSNGATVGSDTGTCTTTDVGNGWYRITVSGTSASNAEMIYIDFQFTDSSGQAAPSTNVANGSAIFIWGAQLEQRSSATAYTATTTAPVVKYQPVLQTAASGAARFDHDPVTSESKGLLIEEARTNLLPYSADFSNSAWVKSKAAVYSNQVIAPDGTQNADNVVGTTVSGEHYVQDDLTAATGTFTDSVFVKANGVTSFFIRPVHVGADEGDTQTATFNLSNGTIASLPSNTTATITDVGNDWYRCTFTFTITGTLSGSYGVRLQLSVTGDGYKGVYLWGAQREAGSFPTSYIPTSGSTVTRAADAAAITGSNFNFFSNQQGSLYAETEIFDVYKGTDIFPRTIAFVGDDADQDHIAFYHQITSSTKQTNSSVLRSGTTYASNILQNAMADGFIKMSIGFANDDIAAVANNGTGVVTDTSAVLPDITELRIFGSVRYQPAPNGYIKKVAYYPKRLSNATLQAMTTE